MDKQEGDKQGVSLPSAAQTEAQTILEKQNLIKVPKGASGDKSSAVVEASDDESESDNEDIVDVVKKDVNLDNEFEKIVPFKFKRLSEESIDEVDHEIAEILQEAAPLGKEVQSEVEKTQFEIKAITPEEEVSTELENSRFDVQVVDEKAEAAELIKKEIEESEAELNTVTPTNELKEPETDKLTSSANENTKLEATEPSISDSNANKTIIDGEPMPKEEDESVNENTDDKPPVPIQTYLWEDVKRSKEQVSGDNGGYPWTHLYKEPLGPDDDPQSILSYKQSPRAARKASNDQGTPKSQKKVRIQDEIEIQETENYIQDLSDDETIKSGDDNLDSDVEEEVPEAPAEEKSEPKGILKRSQKLLENIKPNTSKFDSGSLKKKIKNPFTKIKNMADEQFKRVKAARPSIKKLSVGKDEIVLNEEVKILKLKESPVSEHREYPSYVVQHQDSEDSVEIMKLDESPSIKRRENEAHVTPDEIIELPTAKQSDDKIEQQREGTVESREISIRSSSSPLKTVSPVVPKKREHQYEDIEDYISKITDDGESVERAPPAPDTNIHHYHKAGSIDDPIFDEFSRQFNKNIRLSLSAQDDKMRQELAKKIPKIEELEKQISDEDREEKIEGSLKQMHLLAPISSIDSTSSDEASKAHLSILAEESESDSNKKKSFDDSTFDRDLSSFERDVESLKNDGSDVSMTLIEDELKNLEERQEVKQIENFVELMTVDAFIKPEETEISVEPKAPEVESSEIENSVETKIQTSEIPEAFETQEAPEAAHSETLEAQEAEKSDEPEQVVKEDVIVKKEAEATSPIKVSSRWSKMRSSSLGAVPHKKPLSRSRAASNQPAPLEVRCACQFFQSDSLIPERINPIGSRPPSRLSDSEKPINTSRPNILESTVEEEDLTGSVLSFGKSSAPDYYGETSNTSYRVDSRDVPLNFSQHQDHEPLRQINQPLTFDQRSVPIKINQTFDNRSIPSIEVENYTRNYPDLNLSQNIRPSHQGQYSSQKSLDRYSTSTLLNRYRPMSQSHAPSLQGSSADIRAMPKMTKTVSFDYGKPTYTKRNSIANENPNFDQYHRMSPMVFPIRDRLQKFDRMHDQRDHEYEPIGEPQLDETVTDLDHPDSQKRKTSDTDAGNEKKFLRTPTQESDDNISAQDFQNEIENRFFTKEIEPMVDDEAHAVHQENTFDEAVIIDETPVKRDVPRKRNFIKNAQESGMNFHKKIKAQAGIFKNKIKKKPKEKPVAVEIAQENIEPPADEEIETETIVETIETVDVSTSEAPTKSKSFKMPNFKKPTMPKFNKVERPSMPDLKLGGRFSNLGKKLGRSKSMKEESVVTDTTSYTTPEASTAEPTKKKFDFGTYPRMIRDKFKRQKVPERSDQSVRSETPPTIEFTNVSGQFAQRGPVASRWPEYDSESGKYQQFNSETDLDRESSIERRMRLDYERSTEEREDFEIVKRLMNEEQRQLDEMDRENQEIHLMAKQERYKKPMVERQGSDVGSEEDKLLWSGMLNKDSAKDDFEEGNALRYDDDYKYSMDQYKNESDINRSYTPQTNQETQSSGSSGTRRRKGDLDDEDDYFLRENRISNEIHIGDYISSAIKEGLSTPEDNALAQMGGFDRSFDQGKHELTPEIPSRSLKRKGKKPQEPPVDDEESSWQQQNVASFKDFYKTFPPDRPVRKQKKSECESELADDMDLSEDHPIPDSYNADDLIEDMNDRELFYHQQILKGLDHPDMIGKDDFDNEMDYNISNLPIPPTPPRRRKKKIRSPQPVVNLRNDKVQERAALAEQNVQVFRYDQKFVPLAREEKFTPTPPRRTRSRSQISAHTLDDADSFKHDSIETFNVQDKENGYAQVRKDLPPRPVRRKRSTKSLGERQFATMPHLKRQSETPPPRPAKKYSTIIPNKPPRRKSSGSLVEISQITKNDDDDYEEILDSNQENHDNAAVLRLKSGEIVRRMKDRPLPPPPRPKREHKKHKKDEGGDDEDKFDKDDGAEKITGQLSVETDFSDEQLHEVKESLPRQDSDFSEHEKVVEVEVSTQTDPVLDEDFVCDENEDCDIDEFLSSDGKMKTLEDILKEEQEAELERARQLAEAENLSRGIQRFRDSSQRSMSEKSGKTDRTSGSRSRSLSRPITPSAVVVERKKSSPIIFQSQEQTLTEAGLFIHPITYDDYGIPHSDDEQNETAGENLDVNNNFDAIVAAEEIIQEVSMSTVNFIEDKPAEEDDFDAEMQRKIEEMIESVMSSAQEEVEWLRASNDEIQSSPVESSVRVEISQPEETPEPVEQADEPPLPPPRRKSTVIEEPVKKETKKEVLPEFDESQIVTVTKTRTQYTQREPEVVPETDANNEVEVCEEPCVQRFVKRPVIHEDGHVMEDHHKTNEALSDHHKTNETLPAQLTSHMHLSSLEIDNLSVTSLNAGRISASEIDSNTIVTNDLEVKSTNNVPSPRSIEFPPGFIEEIVERVRNAERAEHQTDEHPPARPPLPAQFNFPELTTNIPPSFYELRDPSEEEVALPQMPHRRKKQPSKRKGSTSEEDNQQREQRMRNRGGDQSVMGLGGQFARACGNAIKESGGNLMAVLRASCKDENKRDLHIALIILIIIVAGLVLMGMGDKSVHHHHWDFFNPPDNHGR